MCWKNASFLVYAAEFFRADIQESSAKPKTTEFNFKVIIHLAIGIYFWIFFILPQPRNKKLQKYVSTMQSMDSPRSCLSNWESLLRTKDGTYLHEVDMRRVVAAHMNTA